MNEKVIRSIAFRMSTKELTEECQRLKRLMEKTDERKLRRDIRTFRSILMKELKSRQMKLKGF